MKGLLFRLADTKSSSGLSYLRTTGKELFYPGRDVLLTVTSTRSFWFTDRLIE